jgi:hypothetical protein
LQEGVEKPVVIVRCARGGWQELTVDSGVFRRQCESNAQRIAVTLEE